MNNEIIELLLYKLEQNYKCEKENYFILYKPDIKDLLDYITNLQEYNPKYYKGEKFYGDSREELQQRIDKAIEHIEKYTRWFDSEYASIYGELCSCQGANSNRLEVMVNPRNLLNILKGDDENGESKIDTKR